MHIKEEVKPKFPLKLNLQFFSEPNPDPNGAGGATEPEPKTTPEGADKTFTQEEVDKMIKERLVREKRKADEKAEEARKEAEKKALIENEKYKELYETLQQDLAEQKALALTAKRDSLLAQAGYSPEQISKYAKFVDGTNDEELLASIEELKVDLPPKGTTFVDPSGNNPRKQDPKPVDAYEAGKERIKRLKAQGLL
jgi:hypothetical protein